MGVGSGEVLLVDVRSAEVKKRYVGHTSVVMSVAVSKDSRSIVSGSSDGKVRMWDVKRGVSIGDPLIGHEESGLVSGGKRGSRSHCLWRVRWNDTAVETEQWWADWEAITRSQRSSAISVFE